MEMTMQLEVMWRHASMDVIEWVGLMSKGNGPQVQALRLRRHPREMPPAPQGTRATPTRIPYSPPANGGATCMTGT